jgi:hypothetical protein
MKITLILLGMLATCGVFGTLLLSAFRAPATFRRIAFHVGYSYALIAFYLLYTLFHSVTSATWFTLIIPVVLYAIRVMAKWVKARDGMVEAPPATNSENNRGWSWLAYPVAVTVIVFLFAAWPYLLSGWGNYWHSGNYDIEDALNGRDAYVTNLIYGSPSFDTGAVIGDQALYNYYQVTHSLQKKLIEAGTYKEWFAGDSFRFQYSSMAFWSVLFNELHGVDVFLIQSILSLLLMALGIFYLSQEVFALSALAAAIAAVVATANTFYLGTFFAGHEGSLIYGSLIPALLYLSLVKSDGPGRITFRLLIGGLIGGAIVYSYAQALPLVALPVILYGVISYAPFRRRASATYTAIIRQPWLLVFSLVVAVVAVAALLMLLWHVSGDYRLRQASEYRSWSFTHAWLILPLFLGVFPSPLGGSSYVGSQLSPEVYAGLVVVSAVLASLFLVCYFKPSAQRNPRFSLVFGLCWIAEYLIFRYFIVDSYYLYKFLYTHQFILIIGVVSYVARSRSRMLRALGAAVILANGWAGFTMAQELYVRPYNRNAVRFESLVNFDRKILQNSFVELTGGDAVATRQTLLAHGIQRILDPRRADYFIVPASRDADITGGQFKETVYRAHGLAIKRSPAYNYLTVRTWTEPEQFSADPVLKDTVFRWVGQNRNDSLAIYVSRPKLTDELRGKYLRICAQRGPSATGSIDLTVSAGGQDILSAVTLEDGVRCLWIPAEKVLSASQPLVIHSGAKGKSLLPHDDRVLLYRVFAVGWAERIYDDRAMRFFASQGPDIVKNRSDHDGRGVKPSAELHLGQGWGMVEHAGPQVFRWAGRATDLLVTGADHDGLVDVVVDLEPGPSHGPHPMALEVLDSAGKLVFTSATVTGRNTVVLSLPCLKLQTSVYTFRTHSDNLVIPHDPRILNYRVFSLTLH